MDGEKSKAQGEVRRPGPASPDADASGAVAPDLLLALLQRRDLAAETIAGIAKHPGLALNHKLSLAFVLHPRAPARTAVSLLRHLFAIELMQVALAPAASPELKLSAERALLRRLPACSSGERLALARRASAAVAAALLLDRQPQICAVALENPRLSEPRLIAALASPQASAEFLGRVCAHHKWSARQEIRIALIENENTPTEQAQALAAALPPRLRQRILAASSLSASRKALLAGGAPPSASGQ
jgi:hypothetical protein